MITSCPHCQGEGYLLSVGRPGAYSLREASYFPSEAFVTCPECEGAGELLICPECEQVPVISGGREVCACTDALARAA